MRTAERTLEILGTISKQHPDYVFHRVYRELFNRDLLLRAYLKLAPNEGNMTRGTDGKTIDGFGMALVDEIIDELRSERFYPKPARREYIPKANGKMRPLGIPTFKDKLVQEALKELLEAIYEPVFSDSSHGFRPGRDCHSALHSIQYGCKGATWVIEGDITSFFDNIDHEILLKLISRKVNDGRVLELIRRFLKAGYIEDCSFKESLLGSPQGGVLSPLLANIYLNELDRFVEELRAEYERGERRKMNVEYNRVNASMHYAEKTGKREKAETLKKKLRDMDTFDPMDDGFVRIRYVRYADDWCIFIIGSKSLAYELKGKVALFLKEELHLELSESKTHVTNLAHDRVRFLGYEIFKLNRDNGTRRAGCISFGVPADVIRERIRQCTRNGKPSPRNDLLSQPVENIMWTYASEINGLYNYYCLAANVAKRLHHYAWFHRRSMVNTIAKKERLSSAKVRRKYGRVVPCPSGHGTVKALCVMDDDRMTAYYPFAGFVKKDYCFKPEPGEVKEFGPRLKERILADECEVCHAMGHVEVHHVRSLKQTAGRYAGKVLPYWLNLMLSMRSKTLVLCPECHKMLHSGKLIRLQGSTGEPDALKGARPVREEGRGDLRP